MKKNLLILIAMLIGGFISAQSVSQSTVIVDEGTEFHHPLSQMNNLETDAMSLWV